MMTGEARKNPVSTHILRMKQNDTVGEIDFSLPRSPLARLEGRAAGPAHGVILERGRQVDQP